MPATPRAVCIDALLRWEKGEVFADDILHEVLERSGLPTRDRAFLTEIFYGILRNRTRLDFLIETLRPRPLDDETHQIMRLGLYQLFEMRVPEHAAVNETVRLSTRARGVVNALLRRAIREREALEAAVQGAPDEVRLSHPNFLMDRWRRTFGDQSTNELCAWNNRPAEMFARVNTLRVSTGELLRSTPGAAALAAHPGMLRLDTMPLPWVVQGLCYVQDPSTLLACDTLAPQPGERVLDACAAPGGKTSYLAALMENQGEIVAADASSRRLSRLEENLRRLGVKNTRLVQADWLGGTARDVGGEFDRILLDVPCSNTGVLRRRVDARWRLQPKDFENLPQRQLAMLEAVAPLLKKGGTLVYSTCSLEPEENEELANRAAQTVKGLRLIRKRDRLPFRDSTDGAFAAEFRRES